MINYLLAFLLQNKTYVKYVGYTKNEREWKNYKVVIVPSSFFQDHAAGKVKMPLLPLNQLEGMPILFGYPEAKQVNSTWVIYADLVASAFFLLSRYEETLNPARDAHGRFQAESSLAHKAGFLQRPLVDEYGAYLVRCLQQCGVEVPCTSANMQITLTHDVDVPFVYRNFMSILGGIRRGEFKQLWHNIFRSLENNTFFTFPWLLEQDNRLKDARKIYFLRNPLFPEYYDRPYLKIESADMRRLLRLVKKHDVELGLHVSYASADHIELVQQEKVSIERIIGQPLTANRNHYLRLKTNKQLEALMDAGIKEDFTIGFAEMPGFRLGTCRPVRYIDPLTLKVTDLMLHPLTMMDTSFSHYAAMDDKQAYLTACKLIDQVKRFGGELVLLWHNSEVREGIYHRKLYKKLISYMENAKN